MKITFKIQRFNPETDSAPHYREYTVDADPDSRLLDALMYIKDFQDGSLSFRKSCAHGVCGSDAMRINGSDRLACKTLIKEVVAAEGDTVVIEPLRYLPVQKDLIVDQSAFFEKYRAIMPYLINDEPVPEKERLQSQAERMRFDDTTNCILCAACYSACPIPEKKPGFLGPAAIAQAFRFNADSRDRGFTERLAALDQPEGVWSCEKYFNCTRTCPRAILITKRINQTQKQIKDYRTEKGEDVHDAE